MTQGPTQNTIIDLKNLIVQQQIDCVVMLCRLIQSGKSRCSDYTTNQNTKSVDQIQDYLIIKQIQLGEDFNNQTYRHIQYSQWPDKKVPTAISHIEELVQRIKGYKNIVIHCSAGLGRSGVIAALLFIMESQEYKNQQKISIFRIVRKIREYRFGAIQNSEQYRFLYDFFQHISKR